MSRRKQKPIRRVQVPIAQLNAIVERTRTAPLPADEHATLKAAVDTLARLTEELETTTTTLERLRRLIFGPRTETTATVLGNGQPDPSDTPAPPADTAPSAGDAAAADRIIDCDVGVFGLIERDGEEPGLGRSRNHGHGHSRRDCGDGPRPGDIDFRARRWCCRVVGA